MPCRSIPPRGGGPRSARVRRKATQARSGGGELVRSASPTLAIPGSPPSYCRAPGSDTSTAIVLGNLVGLIDSTIKRGDGLGVEPVERGVHDQPSGPHRAARRGSRRAGEVERGGRICRQPAGRGWVWQHWQSLTSQDSSLGVSAGARTSCRWQFRRLEPHDGRRGLRRATSLNPASVVHGLGTDHMESSLEPASSVHRYVKQVACFLA